MTTSEFRLCCGVVVTVIVCLTGSPAFGQGGPWAVFLDDQSESECGVINADNAEFVMLNDTRELVVITAADRILPGSSVTLSGDVLIDGEVFGAITYATDGDGMRTVWWLTLTGRVVQIDDVSLEPSVSEHVPADFLDVPCDACDFWDDPSVCPASAEPRPTLGLCGAGLGPATLSLSLVGLVGMGALRTSARARAHGRSVWDRLSSLSD